MPMLCTRGTALQSVGRRKGPGVKTTQHVLIIGDSEQAVRKLPLVNADDYQFSYCARDNRDSESIVNRHSFDWILFHGASLRGDQMDLIQSLRTIGFFSSEKMTRGRSGCQLEWTEKGILQLHCCMQAGLHNAAAGECGEDQHSCIFEFHAPMKQVG